jgi:uncharacterized membrane protein
MHTIEESIVIGCPRMDVWAYIADVRNYPTWMSSVIESETDNSGPPQVGDRSRIVVKVVGRRIEMTNELTEVVQGQRLADTSVSGPFPSSSSFDFEDVPDGTRVTMRGETPGLGGFFGKLGDPVVVKMLARDMRSDLQNLKTILEES